MRVGKMIREERRVKEPAMVEFVDQSTIHGLKHATQSGDCISKIFWSFVLLGCFVGGSYEIYQVVSYYRLKPSATQVSWTIQNEYEFPPLAFCPKRWFHVTKADQLGLKGDALAYTFSFLLSDIEVSETFDEAKIMADIRSLMVRSGINSFAELIKSIAYGDQGLLRVISTPNNLTLAPAIIDGGLCYVIKVAPLRSGMLRTNVMLNLEYDSPSRTHEYDKRFQSRMLVRDWTGQRMNPISLTRSGIYEIDFQSEMHHRMSRPNKPCHQSEGFLPGKWMRTASDVCESVCMDREKVRVHCAGCIDIEVIDLLDLHMDDARPCSHIHKPSNRQHSVANNTSFHSKSVSCRPSQVTEMSQICKDACIPPCRQSIFKSTATKLSETVDGAVTIWITYNPIDGILSFEEVPTYTWDNFLSNIGGQLGLWLGISVISVVQVLYYFGLACARAVKRANMIPP